MSKRDRGGLFTLITALFVVALAGLVFKATWDLASLNAKYPHEAEQSAEQYADRTHERIASTCANMAPTALAKCADEIVKSSHEAQTAQRDLAAQQGMHFWAIAIFWATAASVVITGVGIFFVYRTLQETGASDERQQRAYISVRPAGIQQLIGDSLCAIGHVVVENVGQTPGRKANVQVRMDLSEDKYPDKAFFGFENICRVEVDRSAHPHAGMMQGSQEPYIPIRDFYDMRDGFAFVYGAVFYDDVFGRSHVTRYCHRYAIASRSDREPKIGRIDKSRDVISEEKARYHEYGNDAD